VVAGVAVAAALWWLSVSALIGKLKLRFSITVLERINHRSGILIAAFRFVLLMQAFG